MKKIKAQEVLAADQSLAESRIMASLQPRIGKKYLETDRRIDWPTRDITNNLVSKPWDQNYKNMPLTSYESDGPYTENFNWKGQTARLFGI